MRNFITALNLVIPSLGAGFTILALPWVHDFDSVLQLALFGLWVVCAIRLWSSPRLWAWIGSLVAVSVITLQFGAYTLRFLGLFWQAAYGDRSVELDPSTVGIPLAGLGLMTVGAMFFLVLLLSLPVWRDKKVGNAPS